MEMRYLIPEEAAEKAIFHHYLQLVLPKIPSAWPWLPLKLPPGWVRGPSSSAGLQEFGMPHPSKAKLTLALSGQGLVTHLLEQCSAAVPFASQYSARKWEGGTPGSLESLAVPSLSSNCSACGEESPFVKPRSLCCWECRRLLLKGKHNVWLCSLPSQGGQGSWIKKAHTYAY